MQELQVILMDFTMGVNLKCTDDYAAKSKQNDFEIAQIVNKHKGNTYSEH